MPLTFVSVDVLQQIPNQALRSIEEVWPLCQLTHLEGRFSRWGVLAQARPATCEKECLAEEPRGGHRMQQAVEVAQGRNDEMAEATKTAECQNGLPGESGGNLGPRRPNKCMECNCLASLLSTADRRLG